MLKSKLFVAVTAATLLFAPAISLAQTQPDPHHTQQNGEQGAASGDQLAAGNPMMNMMNMMTGMMKMMSGGQMGMGGMDMAGMGMTERVEGRIAFLAAELNITDAQNELWNTYADVLRGNAKRLKGMSGMMADMKGPALLSQLEAQEKALTARLEGVKAMKAALTPLYEALSEDQRKTADELLAPHMGLMGQGMMQGGMMQGGMMQGNGAQSGSMPMQNNGQ